jgi:protein TonB
MTLAAMDNGDFKRWIGSAALVLAFHATCVLMLMRWNDTVEGDEGSSAIVVDLAPYVVLPDQSEANIAPGPLQQEVEPTPQTQPQKEEKVDENLELPQAPTPEVVLPPETKTLEPPKEEPTPPVEQTTAPPLPRPTAAQTASWHRKIATQIERNKRYPAEAQSRHQAGVVHLTFTIDRQGRIVSSRVVQSSGFASLDQETLATVKRAQPFPAPPPNMRGETFEFTMPIRFNLR